MELPNLHSDSAELEELPHRIDQAAEVSDHDDNHKKEKILNI